MHAPDPFISLVVTFDLITLIHDTHAITGRESVSMATVFQRCLSRKVEEGSEICTPHFQQKERAQPFTTMMANVHFRWALADDKQSQSYVSSIVLCKISIIWTSIQRHHRLIVNTISTVLIWRCLVTEWVELSWSRYIGSCRNYIFAYLNIETSMHLAASVQRINLINAMWSL